MHQRPRVNYLIVVKSHFFDPFMERQVARLKTQSTAPLVILVDTTAAAVALPAPESVVLFDENDLADTGLPLVSEKGGVIWWNRDYPNYLARQWWPDHDYYVFVEYDAMILSDLDAMMARVAERHLDFVALPTRESLISWHWTKDHTDAYPVSEMRRSLNCVSIASARAVDTFFQRRVEMGVEYENRSLSYWPMNEVFLATEALRAGYLTASLEEFGDTAHYEWHPPLLEDDLGTVTSGFIHPVLDRDRYIASVLKFVGPWQYLNPKSELIADFRRFPIREWVPRMPSAFLRSVALRRENKRTFRQTRVIHE